MIKVFDVPLTVDLTPFASFLWANEIPHRITEDEAQQSLWVPNQINPERILYLYQQWQQGVDLSNIRMQRPIHQRANPLKFPITLTVILLSALFSLLIGFGTEHTVMRWLTITDFKIEGQTLIYTDLFESLKSLQIWRFISPVFMHFNAPHILFNALWIWVIGRKIETTQGALIYLTVLLISAVVSNIAQFWVSGPMFGGLSGVVFAVLAYTWLWDKIAARPLFGFPPALMVFMVFWLILGYTQLLEAVGFGSIANTAHLAGLLSGLAAVFIVKLLFKTR